MERQGCCSQPATMLQPWRLPYAFSQIRPDLTPWERRPQLTRPGLRPTVLFLPMNACMSGFSPESIVA